MLRIGDRADFSEAGYLCVYLYRPGVLQDSLYDRQTDKSQQRELHRRATIDVTALRLDPCMSSNRG